MISEYHATNSIISFVYLLYLYAELKGKKLS